VSAYERDDENGLDDLLRGFSPWEDWEWRAAQQGARVGMGCATTETWEVDLDAKLQRWLSRRVGVGYRHLQQQELGESVAFDEFLLGYRAPTGWWGGGTYRPSFDKQRHDAGLFAGWYGDSAHWARAHLGFEDALNNFWEGRTEYIEDKERRRYEANPREIEVAGLWRDAGSRGPGGAGPGDAGRGAGRHGAALRAAWVPEYARHLTPVPSDSALPSRLELTGWLAAADLFAEAGRGWTLGLRARLKGCDRKDFLDETSAPGEYAAYDVGRLRDGYARPWGAKRLGGRWVLRAQGQARWSSESHDTPLGAHSLATRHLGGLATVVWGVWPFLDAEAGLAADWVRVRQEGPPELDVFTHGTRRESRAVVALDFHWNGAHLVLIESLEGDDEGYQTVGFHDKGFAHLTIQF
jgi:hypothetical protein